MSRIGNRVLTIPAGVTVEVNDNVITVKGPKGELSQKIVNGLNVKIEDGSLTVEKTEDKKELEAMFGTTNALIKNMIKGVSEGYEKGLEIIGVGYKFQVRGTTLVVSSGKSHTDEITILSTKNKGSVSYSPSTTESNLEIKISKTLQFEK